MLVHRIIKLAITQPKFLVPVAFAHRNDESCPVTNSGKAHSESCPVTKPRKVCPGAGGLKKKRVLIKRGPVCPEKEEKDVDGGGDDGNGGKVLRRASKSGKCRMGFIPEGWFLFFKPMTGVSGPYIFMIGLGNYLVSKEIFVMEHEYYSGLSVALVLYYVTTRMGPKIGSILDEKVDAIANEFEQRRKDDLSHYEKQMGESKLAISRAQGMKDLINVKKENIAIQLEAIYRERLQIVYKQVQRRMDYQVWRHWKESRIYHKWLIKWVLENVQKSITPEFKKQALIDAIKELNVIATRPKK